MGVTHRHGRPPLPANNNYKVFANGAERVGYTATRPGPTATNAEPYDGRPASIQDGFNFQGDKHGVEVVDARRRAAKAGRTGNLDLRPELPRRADHARRHGRVDGVLYIDTDGALQRQRAKAVCVAGNAIESARLLLLSARRRTRTGSRTRRARSAATTCAT